MRLTIRFTRDLSGLIGCKLTLAHNDMPSHTFFFMRFFLSYYYTKHYYFYCKKVLFSIIRCHLVWQVKANFPSGFFYYFLKVAVCQLEKSRGSFLLQFFHKKYFKLLILNYVSQHMALTNCQFSKN